MIRVRPPTAAVWFALVMASAAGFAVTAQSALAFDVTSVKENRSLEIDGHFGRVPGRFTVTNLPLAQAIRYAFNVRSYQVVDLPSWAKDTKYDIAGIYSNANALDGDVRTMLQTLLTDRFGLRAHRERRELPAYALVAARSDGRLGPKLTRSTVDCERWRLEQAARPLDPLGPRSAPGCVSFVTNAFTRGYSVPIAELVASLQLLVALPVIDRTELEGLFDFELRWDPAAVTGASMELATVDGWSNILTALPEQLGLKLEPTRALYDVIVIDSVRRPLPD